MAGCSSEAKKGFTLMEMIVSIAIIGTMSGLMLANFRDGQESAEARLAAEVLVNRLRDQQTAALAGRRVAVCTGGASDLDVCEPKSPPVTCGAGVCQKRVPTGYGLRFTLTAPRNVMKFYDTDGDRLYDAGEEISSEPYVSSALVEIASTSVGLPLDVVFSPSDGRIYANGDPDAPDQLTITLRHVNDENLTRDIHVFRISGKIEFD